MCLSGKPLPNIVDVEHVYCNSIFIGQKQAMNYGMIPLNYKCLLTIYFEL